jgi:hypothetical protein
MFRALRIGILLFVLLSVAVGTWRAKHDATEWIAPLDVVIYPINGDQSRAAKDYLTSVSDELFAPIEQFMTREAARYGVRTSWGDAVRIRVAPQVLAHPPAPPLAGSALQVIWWSLKLRYWVWRNDAYPGPPPQVRIFVQYYDAETHPVLQHSLGLEKGMIGVVNAFANRRMTGSNNVVIAHELLHTAGATDKYDLATSLPRLPEGYAEPQRSPLYPQDKAELMGGRIPLDSSRAAIPDGLHQVVIGPQTALEINWRK